MSSDKLNTRANPKNNSAFRLLVILLLVSSLIVYLEWGKNYQMFLFQMEAEIFAKLIVEPQSILHPFIILPLAGQVLLIISLFSNTIYKPIVYTGIGFMAVLILFILFVGILSSNLNIALSSLPFLISGIFVLRFLRKLKIKSIKL